MCSFGVNWIRISDTRSVCIMVHQRNHWTRNQGRFKGSFDAPWSRQILDHLSWSRSPQRNPTLVPRRSLSSFLNQSQFQKSQDKQEIANPVRRNLLTRTTLEAWDVNIYSSCAVNLCVKELNAMSENNLTWITLGIRPIWKGSLCYSLSSLDAADDKECS